MSQRQNRHDGYGDVNAARLHRLTGAVPRARMTPSPSPLPPMKRKQQRRTPSDGAMNGAGQASDLQDLSPMAHIQRLARLSVEKNKASLAEAKRTNEHLSQLSRKLQRQRKAATQAEQNGPWRLEAAKAGVDRMREEISNLAMARARKERKLQALKDSPLLIRPSKIDQSAARVANDRKADDKFAGTVLGSERRRSSGVTDAGRRLSVLSAKFDDTIVRAATLASYRN
eukprot:SAG31_NODE_7695_length_1615_cov_0.712401_1_plen_227_part_10